MRTTEAENGRMVEGVKAGANGYVLKPVAPDILKAQVKKACGVAV